MKVKDIMTREVQTVSGSATVEEAGRLMLNHDIGSLPVTDRNGSVVGFMTDRDIAIKVVAQGLDPRKTRVQQVMTPHVEACVDDREVGDAAAIMEEKKVRRLLVLDESGKLEGILSIGDIACRTHDSKITEEIVERVSEHAAPPAASRCVLHTKAR